MNSETANQIHSEFNLQKKWRTVLLLALAELLVMGLWSFAILALGRLFGIWAMRRL